MKKISLILAIATFVLLAVAAPPLWASDTDSLFFDTTHDVNLVPAVLDDLNLDVAIVSDSALPRERMPALKPYDGDMTSTDAGSTVIPKGGGLYGACIS